MFWYLRRHVIVGPLMNVYVDRRFKSLIGKMYFSSTLAIIYVFLSSYKFNDIVRHSYHEYLLNIELIRTDK